MNDSLCANASVDMGRRLSPPNESQRVNSPPLNWVGPGLAWLRAAARFPLPPGAAQHTHAHLVSCAGLHSHNHASEQVSQVSLSGGPRGRPSPSALTRLFTSLLPPALHLWGIGTI